MSTKDTTLEDLKQIALEEGIVKAVRKARKLDDPYILDALHDALADELKQQLREKGEIEEL